MTYDESYQGEVKVTIIATGFSDANQDMMVKAGSLRDMTGGWKSRGTSPSSSGARSQDFVSRSMSNSNVQANNAQVQQEESKPQIDFETPPFLRKKLGQ